MALARTIAIIAVGTAFMAAPAVFAASTPPAEPDPSDLTWAECVMLARIGSDPELLERAIESQSPLEIELTKSKIEICIDLIRPDSENNH